MTENLSQIAVFFAGFLSFLSPCILPFIPPYIGWLSGISLSPVRNKASNGENNSYQDLKKSKLRLKLFLNSFFFVLGFSLIFIILGATASFLGKLLISLRIPLQQIGGVVIIIFGLHLAGALKIPILLPERRLKLPGFLNPVRSNLGRQDTPPRPGTSNGVNKIGYFRSFLIGSIFAFGWVACVGPILASILVLAGISATLWQGVSFLAIYSLGLAIPFLLTSLFMTEAINYLKNFASFARFIPIISGGLLIILGILFLTNEFQKTVSWLYNLYNNLGIPIY